MSKHQVVQALLCAFLIATQEFSQIMWFIHIKADPSTAIGISLTLYSTAISIYISRKITDWLTT